MRKIKSFFRSPMGTLFTFMLAVLLLMTGTIGGVRAAPQIFNPDFAYSGVELDQIGITLVENGNNKVVDLSSRNYNKSIQDFEYASNSSDPKMGALLTNMLAEGEKLKFGYAYPERLSVRNSGSIPEYVRVTVYKYWVDGEDRFDAYDDKGNDVLNDLIDLHFLETNGWVIDHNSDTKERTVLYYREVLDTEDSGNPYQTPDFTDTLTIDNTIVDYAKITTETGPNTVTWVADGMQFMIEVEADGVQNHNARAAMKSAWGLTDSDIARLGLNVA